MSNESEVVVLIDDDGETYEVDAADCEEDGNGFWCALNDGYVGEGEESYFEYVDLDDYEADE